MVVRCAKTRTSQVHLECHATMPSACWRNGGGRDCLLKLEDLSVVSELKEEPGGDALIAFSMPEFVARAQVVYDSLGIIQITFENVWAVFTSMLPLVFV